MKENIKQILICSAIGIAMAFFVGGMVATLIPITIGILAIAGEILYQREKKKEMED